MDLEIVQYPAEVLRHPTEPVTDITGELVNTIDKMFDAMYAASGVGLAAPQVGLSDQLFIMDPRDDGDPLPLVLINPRITEQEGSIVWEEGCLSIPGYFAEVERSNLVTVSAIDKNGDPFEATFEGFPAVIIQHELDHLHGTLFVDYLSRTRLRLFEKDFGVDRFRWKYQSKK